MSRWRLGSGPVGGRPRPEPVDEHLSRTAIRALYRIILAAVLGIIALSATGALLRSGLVGTAGDLASSADEALSVLGNIASAAVGGLVGWLTRDLVSQRLPVSEYGDDLDDLDDDPDDPTPDPIGRDV